MAMDKIGFVQKYIDRGWAVFPVAPSSKLPLIPAAHRPGEPPCRGECGEHGHGCWDATTDDATVGAWWHRWPDANIGIATGAPSQHWVLDFDPANAGAAGTEAEVTSIVNQLPPTHVGTGGGGLHWRFAMPDGFEVTNRRGTLPTGLDVRGTGGYVVAPPSVSGKGAYVELSDADPYDAPGWLLDMIRPAERSPTARDGPPAGWSPPESPAGAGDRGQRYAAGAVTQLLDGLAGAPEGTRNDTAYRTACRLIEIGNADWASTAVNWHGYRLAGERCGLDERELAAVWESARRHVADRPAELPPEWTDPTRAEVWAVPADVAGVPPFSPRSNGAELIQVPPSTSMITPNGSVPGFSEPGTATSVDPHVAAWERAVQAEVNRIVVRDEAKRRIEAGRLGDRGAAKARLRAELLTTEQMLARPRLRPLVAGALYLNTLARINGDSGHGKSFVVLDIACRVALGLPWAGLVTTRRTVGYVVAEGDEGIGARVDAWCAHNGADRADVAVTWLPRAVQIGGPEWGIWCELMSEAGHGLIIFDTQARSTVGRDEIDGRDMGEVIEALDGLRTATGACVLLVHHTPKGGTTGRGHGSVKGAVQTELLASKAGRVITIKGTKQKDGADREDIIFDLVDVPAPEQPGFSEPAGGPSLGVVPVWRSVGVEASTDGGTAREARARALWTAIHGLYNPGMGGTYAECRRAFKDALGWTGPETSAHRKAWSLAWADLIQLGLISKAIGAGRFKVVTLADQSPAGVLSPNRNAKDELIDEGPTGFEVLMTDLPSNEKKAGAQDL